MSKKETNVEPDYKKIGQLVHTLGETSLANFAEGALMMCKSKTPILQLIAASIPLLSAHR
jgi:hypothetical protein